MVRHKLLFTLLMLLNINLSAQFQLEDAFPDLSFNSPVDLQNSGDGTNRIFVVEQAGIIKVFENDRNVSESKIFLDIHSQVRSGGEMGLLGLAFHPDYENNGYFYVNYTHSDPLFSRISRFRVSSTNPDSADPSSELILIDQPQPYTNHNGGQVAFGPDGYLYISLGDGGSAGDPLNNGQKITTLLGKILRIDIDSTQGNLNYAIPPDNPFADSTGDVRKEIYAYGLRNPWRFSFDPVTGWLWCGDVGQNQWEEIDLIVNGKNYGWRCYEGNHPYNLTGCNAPEYIFPVWEYSHSLGYSITGGYVYRGLNVPELHGRYIYADYGSKKVWALEYDSISVPVNTELLTAPYSPTSFGVDENNELYVCLFSTGVDKIYRFVPTVPEPPSNLTGYAGFTPSLPPAIFVHLEWDDNSDNENGFVIERKILNGSFEVIDSVQANQNTYEDYNIDQNQIYTYRVFAFNNSGPSYYSNEFEVTTPVETIQPPSDLIATGVNKNTALLTWQDNSFNEEGFKIERSLQQISGFQIIDSVGMDTQSFSDTTVNPGETYYYRIFAYNDNGISEYSNTDSAYIPGLSDTGDETSRPDNFELSRNYPNPFNPSTSFDISIPERSKVTVKVYNSLGELVEQIISAELERGKYRYQFNPDNLSGGIYFIRMNSISVESGKSFTSTIKAVYLK
ncbi:MAG: hypothetical protein Kow0098_26970 [Ignavibacteriaceae bacterium]